jgi:translation initiation factor 2B subunit (eIF-2B alpha/beta/delta family)
LDNRLLKNINSVIQTRNGLRKARKLSVSAGYSTTMIKDTVRKGANKLKNKIVRNRRLQNYESKSKRVKNNLTKAGAKLRKFKSRRRR